MLQRLGIRGKLLVVVAVPTIVLLLAASFLVFNAAVEQSSARNTAQLVDVVQSGSLLAEGVQGERAAVANYLRALIDGDSKTSAARADVDTTLATITEAGEADPTYAAVAQAVVAAVNGAGGAEGLNAYREITAAPEAQEGFPAWPVADAVATARTGIERIAGEVSAAATAAPVSGIGTVIRGLGDLIRAEAEATATYLNEAKQYSDALPANFETVDRAGADFLQASSNIADRPDNAGVLDFTNALNTRLSNIDGLRGRIRSSDILPGDADAVYSAVVSDVFQLTRNVTDSAANRQLAAYLGAYESMNEVFEAVRSEEAYVARKIRQGEWVAGEPVVFQGLYFGSNNALANAKLAVAGLPDIPPVPSFGVSYDVDERTGFQTVRDRLLDDTSDAALRDQRNAGWEVQVTEELDAMAPIRAELLDQVRQGTSDLVRNSLIQLLATIAIAVIVLVLTLVTTLSMARRIVNPLRRLTTTVTAVRQELPRLVERVALPGETVDISEVQIPVESQDEVGRLAEAFNSVNAATLSIASEQAALRGSISEMFVNVARRDQVLLNRQLSSIDEMERTEDNQTTLTKLFALDHLATRMRRNSESLLVLAGIDTGRRLRRAMPLSDVIRTASSEIEMYERVQLELDVDPSMLGHSALTAAHLFAELLENATVFSDPGSPVVVRTMTEGENVCVEVVDNGIGMTPEELAEANARVASTAASEILGAQRLGLFVVGRIARRVGARVQLESVEGGGICARVVMPPSLFDAPSATDATNAPEEGAQDPTMSVRYSTTDAEGSVPLSAMAQPADASPHEYQPTAIEEGSILAGRAVEPPATADAVAASPVESLSELDKLVAADAATAPEAVPVDVEALTEAAMPSGLPTRRRRRAEGGPDAAPETHSIMALPMRASDEQLSALESAATSGFTPILAADEVSPESAEQRSRVFRGFRPLRGESDEQAGIAPDAESLGHAARRGAPAAELSGQDDALAAGHQASREGAVTQPSSPFAVEPSDPRSDDSPVVRQSPLIATGFTGEDLDTPVDAARGEEAQPPMSIPMLEEDEPEPEPSSPWNQQEGTPSAGVESVTLDDAPYPPAPRAQGRGADASPEAEVPESDPGFRTSLYPSAPSSQTPAAKDPVEGSARDGQQAVSDASPQFEIDPVASTPSLDDLISDGSRSAGTEERGGFFSRVFGRGRKPDEEPSESSSQPLEFIAPVSEPPAPLAPEQAAYPEPSGEPAAPPVSAPPVSAPTTSRYDTQGPSQWAPLSGDLPAPIPAEPRAPEETSMWIGTSPAAAVGEPERPAPADEAPSQDRSADQSEEPPADRAPEPLSPSETRESPAGFLPDLTSNQTFQADWSPPSGSDTPDPAATSDLFVPDGGHDAYSPDQLASPLGWEVAGQSALQAAAPDSTTEYRPVVQIDPQSQAEGSVDYVTDVFSELSSLAAERPKLEKTPAGLVKRTPVARETEPGPSADVAEPEVPRDAEAVRNRFSSFHSGTQRGRRDVKTFKDSTQGSLTES